MQARRIGELRVQVDRWPLTDDEATNHVLTVIVVGAYTEKPSKAVIKVALKDAIELLGD